MNFSSNAHDNNNLQAFIYIIIIPHSRSHHKKMKILSEVSKSAINSEEKKGKILTDRGKRRKTD